MRIGLDLTSLKGPELGGMAWQAFWLARWLPRLAPESTFVFFLPPGVAPPADTPNVEVARVPCPDLRGTRFFVEQLLLPRAAVRARLDLLHTIAFGPPILYGGRKVLTIHDLGFRLYPGTVPGKYARYWNWAYGTAARGCAHLIAVSEATRRDIVMLLKRPEEEISVVPCGIDPVYLATRPHEASATAATPANPHRPYLLNVGVLQPRKDLGTLLRAFARIRAARPDLELVVCGPRGWGYPAPEVLAEEAGLAGAVRFVSGVPQAEMPALYRGAALFLFTSIHEGFGLPLLEAMASGVPVVATNSSAIPEVVGDAARLAPVGDDAGLARAALLLLGDPAARAEQVRLGLARAGQFSWERSARLTLDVYQRILGP